MTTDDDMREIEAALDELLDDASDSALCHMAPANEVRDRLLALIRQKLEGNVAQNPATSAQPATDVSQNDAGSVVSKGGPVHSVIITVDGKVTRFTPATDDAEHERAVEAWKRHLQARGDIVRGFFYFIRQEGVDEALRLMRARPATGKDALQVQAAGELLRAARTKIRNEASNNACEDYAAGMHRAADIIEEAERGLPMPDWRQHVTINSAIDICVRDAAVVDLLRAAKDVLHNFHVDMGHEHRSGFYGPQDVDAMIAMDDAIEAVERAGVR